ncbi:MAG: amidohydrolase family protein [Bacteroidota bacterium]
MLIDFHTHAFAEKIAAKAVDQLINYYKLHTSHSGTLVELLQEENKIKTDAAVLLVAATKASQVAPANDWVLSVKTSSLINRDNSNPYSSLPDLIPFGTFHPDDPDWPSEIDRLRQAGCRGFKLHPEFQGIDLADPRLNPFFEAIAGKFMVLFHMGDAVKTSANKSTPKKLAAILDRFPSLTVIAAHMGGYCFWQESLEELAGRKLYLDTSSTLPYIEKNLFKKIVFKHGTDRILFGSDYPLHSPAQALAEIDSLGWLSSSQKEKILGANAAALLGINRARTTASSLP